MEVPLVWSFSHCSEDNDNKQQITPWRGTTELSVALETVMVIRTNLSV